MRPVMIKTLVLISFLTSCSMFKQPEPEPTGIPDDLELYSQQLIQSMCPASGLIIQFDSGTQTRFREILSETGTVTAEDIRILWGTSEAVIQNANQSLQEIKQYYQARGCEVVP